MYVDRSTGRLGGLNNSESGGVADAKNLRVKLVLLGDSGVGKSCIVLRFVRGQFDPTSKVTIGASFLSQTIALQDSTTVKFEIWDTAGQERYAALAPLYYRGAAVAVIVYDITSPETFNKAQYWVKELQKHGSPDIVMALVGNKADLQEKREVPTQDGIDYAEKNGMFFMETSAKTADNINQLFETVCGLVDVNLLGWEMSPLQTEGREQATLMKLFTPSSYLLQTLACLSRKDSNLPRELHVHKQVRKAYKPQSAGPILRKTPFEVIARRICHTSDFGYPVSD
ncbi:hypothetical protein D5086_015716 [Populus alba]|uniref:Uncharacterized protein n=1 Tax=Populus alba TaxID=43335 RepID=A0ACC4BRY7_POPAL